MAEYIDRYAAIQFVEKHVTNVAVALQGAIDKIAIEVFLTTKDCIKDYLSILPAADVAEVKHGKWKKHTDDYDCDYIECSICGEEFYPPDNEFTFGMTPKYCPNCGAKMDGKENAE